MIIGIISLLRRNAEVVIWITALIALYFMPETTGHFTFCPLGAMGMTWCPGCGVGHAIHHVLHLEFIEAMEHHYLGLFAVLVIVYRIFQLTILDQKLKLDYHGRKDV